MTMIEFIQMTGWVGIANLSCLVAGLIITLTVGRKQDRAWSYAAAFAVAVLAFGAIGFGLGQIMVDHVVNTRPPEIEVQKAIMLLSLGTREASGNLLMGGTGAVLLSLAGAVATLLSKRTSRVG